MKTDLSLPICHGGLNIINSVTSASGEYHASQKISEPLKDMTVQQSESFSKPQPQSIKTHLRRQKQQETESAVQELEKVYLHQSKEWWIYLATKDHRRRYPYCH